MPRAPDAGSTVSWALGLRTRHFVMRRCIPFATQPAFRSVWQACRNLAHHGDRPPYSEPGEQLVPVATPEHPIRIYRGFEFGVASMRVHHQMRSTVDIYIREHRVFPRVSTQRAAKARSDE